MTTVTPDLCPPLSEIHWSLPVSTLNNTTEINSTKYSTNFGWQKKISFVSEQRKSEQCVLLASLICNINFCEWLKPLFIQDSKMCKNCYGLFILRVSRCHSKQTIMWISKFLLATGFTYGGALCWICMYVSLKDSRLGKLQF